MPIVLIIILTTKTTNACEELTCKTSESCLTYDDFVELYKKNNTNYIFFKCEDNKIKYHVYNKIDPEDQEGFFFDKNKNMIGKYNSANCFGIIGCPNSQHVYPYLEDSGDSGVSQPADPRCGCATPVLPTLSLALLPCLLLTRRARRSV